MNHIQSDTERGRDYFYRGHWLTPYHVAASLRIRKRIFDWATLYLPAGRLRVLELGATPDTQRADSNCFAKWFLSRSDRVALASVEDLSHLSGTLPGVEIIPWASLCTFGRVFDLVVSSAVLEHTGSHAADHIALALRLGRNLLLTTPNRYHWLEFHTKLPLLHWLPRPLHRALLASLGLHFWADNENMRLYSARELRRLLADVISSSGVNVRAVYWFFPRFLGAVSNLAVFLEGIE